MSSAQSVRNERHKKLNASRGLKTVAVVVPVACAEELKKIAAKMRDEDSHHLADK